MAGLLGGLGQILLRCVYVKDAVLVLDTNGVDGVLLGCLGYILILRTDPCSNHKSTYLSVQ